MSAPGDSTRSRNDAIEQFIGETLSIFQARWLLIQSEALQQTRSDLLEAILREWFSSNPPETWGEMAEGDIARRAVEEFILRHHKEFLPVSLQRHGFSS